MIEHDHHRHDQRHGDAPPRYATARSLIFVGAFLTFAVSAVAVDVGLRMRRKRRHQREQAGGSQYDDDENDMNGQIAGAGDDEDAERGTTLVNGGGGEGGGGFGGGNINKMPEKVGVGFLRRVVAAVTDASASATARAVWFVDLGLFTLAGGGSKRRRIRPREKFIFQSPTSRIPICYCIPNSF